MLQVVDRFCPRHGRTTRPVTIEGLRCDCPPPPWRADEMPLDTPSDPAAMTEPQLLREVYRLRELERRVDAYREGVDGLNGFLRR